MAAELHALLATDYDVVDVVHDGRALVDAVLRTWPDAIVSDIGMAGLDGLAAAEAILDVRPNARIVFVTVQDSRAVIRSALNRGAQGYVLKCDAGDELAAAVRAAIQGAAYLSSSARLALGPARDQTVEDDRAF